MTSLSTRTKIFREQAGAIRALATARREDGKVFLHADILTALGLPTDKSWQRSLSNWLCKDGIRRRPEYTHKRSDAPEIPALIEDEMEVADEGEIRLKLNQATEAIAAAASYLADLGDMIGCQYVRTTFRSLFCDD